MGTRILLADDSVTIQKVVELTFMDEDYEVVAVSNGDEAVARLAEVQPELVIADVHMPGANGYDVCRQAKQWRPGLPVLLLVGTFEPFQEEEANRAGADGYLKKPFDSQELLRRVEQLLSAARSAPAPALSSAAEEMEPWQPPTDDDGEPEVLFGGAAAEEEDEPRGPLGGQPVPDEMILEASPWEQAEEESSQSWAAAEEPHAVVEEPVAVLPFEPVPSSLAAAPPVAPATGANGAALSASDVDRIARRVVELLGERLVREVAWEVIPDMAELVIKDRLRELERQLEGP